MNNMKKLLCLVLALIMTASLVACGSKDSSKDDNADSTTKVYAVEAGSAGEAVALENGWEVNSVDDQAKALMEVAAGTSDAAIIDLLMAGAMIGEGTSYPDLTYSERLTEEEYGVGCRKGSDLAEFINNVMNTAYTNGTMKNLAKTYGITEDVLVEQLSATDFEAKEGGDVEYIQKKGKLIVGITDFAPMDYKDANNEWIGFDADMARLVAQELGVEIEFVVIDWNNKIFELDGKGIDVVWNGMTLTDEVMAAMECSNPYCKNAQVVVTKIAK